MKQFKSLEEVLETLALQAHFEKALPALKKAMQNASKTIETIQLKLKKFDSNPDAVHNAVNAHPKFSAPKDTTNYPQIKTVFDELTKRMDTLNDNYRKQGTIIFIHGLRCNLWIAYIKRVETLYNQLVTECAQQHINFLREAKKKDFTINPHNPPRKALILAALAVKMLLQRFDRAILKYLDINRHSLVFTLRRNVVTSPRVCCEFTT